MADARGRGFKRGRGKWHAPTVEVKEVDPAELGWEPTEAGYKLADVELVPFELGWKVTQFVTIAGEQRRYSQVVSGALLPLMTRQFLSDLEAA